MTVTNNVIEYFAGPIEKAAQVSDEKGLKSAVHARLLFLAQIISSVVALPIILLVGLCEAPINLMKGENCVLPLKDALLGILLHAYRGLPLSIVGVITPAGAKWLNNK